MAPVCTSHSVYTSYIHYQKALPHSHMDVRSAAERKLTAADQLVPGSVQEIVVLLPLVSARADAVVLCISHEPHGFLILRAAVWAEVAAISLVLILWSKTLLSREKAHSEILPLVILCDGAFLGYIIACIVDLATTSQSWEDWLITSKVYKHLLLVEPCALLFNGVGILWYGSQIRARLIEHPSWTPLPPERKRLSLQRLYGTIFLCCSCFSMRAAFLIYGFTRCDSGDAGMSMAVWLIFSNFIPTIIPALCVMYAMRRPDVNEKNLPIQANNPYTRTPTWVGLSWGTDTSLTAYTQALLRPEIEEERESNARPQSTDFYS
jgi:hypothetical protein